MPHVNIGSGALQMRQSVSERIPGAAMAALCVCVALAIPPLAPGQADTQASGSPLQSFVVKVDGGVVLC
jgi:hypothetical protein